MPDPIVNNDDDKTPTAEELLAQETAAAIARGDVAAEDDEKTGDEKTDEDEAKALKDELGAGEEKPAGESAAAEKDDEKKSGPIPLDRHKTILKKERDARVAAEDALKKSKMSADDVNHEAALAKQEKAIEDLEEVYSKALIDADAKLAANTMSKIRRLEREIGAASAARQANVTEKRAVESTRYDLMVASLEKDYPELNPDHEDYDEVIVSEVMDLKNAFVAGGATPSKALTKAMKYVLTADEPAATDEADTKKADEAKADRTASGIAKKVKAATSTPPNTDKVGLSSDKLGGDGKATAVEIGKMSQAQFAKLSEKDLAAARGDVM